MKAFHNDQAIKEKYLARVKEHRRLDEIIKGTYFKDGEPGHRKMCAVGCTIHSDAHSAYETELGIPEVIAWLEDRIFERLPDDEAKSWPERFLDAIPVGKDLSEIWPKFAIFLLTDKTQCGSKHPQCEIVAAAFKNELSGKKVNWEEVSAFASAAYANAASDAAANAADAADAAYAAANAAYAAYAAAAASASDASAAANAAYAAAAYDAAYAAAYTEQSKKLLELLSS